MDPEHHRPGGRLNKPVQGAVEWGGGSWTSRAQLLGWEQAEGHKICRGELQKDKTMSMSRERHPGDEGTSQTLGLISATSMTLV